jgi:hypothetical protein
VKEDDKEGQGEDETEAECAQDGHERGTIRTRIHTWYVPDRHRLSGSLGFALPREPARVNSAGGYMSPWASGFSRWYFRSACKG